MGVGRGKVRRRGIGGRRPGPEPARRYGLCSYHRCRRPYAAPRPVPDGYCSTNCRVAAWREAHPPPPPPERICAWCEVSYRPKRNGASAYLPPRPPARALALAAAGSGLILALAYYRVSQRQCSTWTHEQHNSLIA